MVAPSAPTRVEQRRAWHDVMGYRLFSRTYEMAASYGTPLVLVHGWGVSSRYMVPIARALGTTRTVYAIDLPGHGQSSRPERALSMTELSDVLVAWLDAVGLDRVALLGNSMGCQVIADLAIRHAGRVERLVLVGPTLDDGARGVMHHVLRMLADVPFERPSLIPIVLSDYWRMGPTLLLEELRQMNTDRELHKMGQVSAPALVVRGERDALVPREWAARVADALHAGPVREVADRGHALNFSAPNELAAIVAPFLDTSLQP